MSVPISHKMPFETDRQYGDRAIAWLATLPDEIRHWAHSRLHQGHSLAELQGKVDAWHSTGGF